VVEDDSALLRAWQAGDAAAGEVLFERHFDALFRFLVTKVGDAADDLVQETFMACVKGRDRFRAHASFRTYLFAVARRKIIDHWRGRGKRQSDDPSVVTAHDMGPSPSSLLNRADDERLLVMALRRIPLDLQMAIELYYVEGLKSREVAEVLEIPHDTVRSRLRRALEQLREWIQRLSESPQTTSTTMSRLDAWAAKLRSDTS
jgi:RNA polymerase sigma-70 factor (ECF subfamily)